NTVSVRQVDVAGNTSAGSSISFTLDTLVSAPNVTLNSDTGVSGDGITSNGTLNITGIESGATVQYSLDGTTWTNSFTPVEGANTVSVRQVDVAGNTSASSSISFTLDTLASASITVDNITSDNIITAAEASGTINVTGTVSGDAKAGDTVTLIVNGQTYSGLVSA